MKKSTTKRMIIMLIIVLSLFAAIIGYHIFAGNMMKKFLASNAKPPATVTIMQAQKEVWLSKLNAVGTLRAVQGVNITAEAAGTVKKIHVESGARVKKDQLLFTLDSDEEQAELKSLQANVKLAELNYQRNQRQLKISAISQAQLDASRADLDHQKAQQEKQRALIAKKQIRAPFAGQLGVNRINLGQYLNIAEPIVSLQNTEALYVDFNIPQKYIGDVHIGQAIEVFHRQAKHATIIGRIHSTDVIVNIDTRNVAIEGRIDNRDGNLLPGMFVEISIQTGQPRSLLTIPQTSISYNAYGTTLFVAREVHSEGEEKDAKPQLIAEQLFVTTGLKRGDQVAIIKGLKEGDRVVTSGQLKLKNGTPLMMNNDVLPANEIAPHPQEQ
ncbi:MAG: efflux RND transporter periplasmic adaptor subunit [Mariprofundaceae bacterium]